MFLNVNLWIEQITKRLEATGDPVRRRNLDIVRKHMLAERDGDLESLMATLSPNPRYEQWGGPERYAPRGTEAVRRFYASGISEGRGAYLEYDMDRIVVDEHCIVTDGVRRSVFPGALISSADGWPVSSYPVENPDDYYLVSERQATTWPFDHETGLLSGEEFYRVVTEVRKLTAEELAEFQAVTGGEALPLLGGGGAV